MSLTVDVASEDVRLPLARRRIADVARRVLRAEKVRHALLSITFLPTPAIRRLNARHLGRPQPTDVIAFRFERATERDPVIGDVYIAPAVARENAHRQQVGVREELTRLVVHGILHVLGYDHPDGAERLRSPMWARQERIVSRLLESPRS